MGNNDMTHAATPAGQVAIWGDADAVAFVEIATRLCEGYTLEELQRMSLTFKAQIDVLRARSGAHFPEPLTVPDEIDRDAALWLASDTEPDAAYRDGWNACRAAMLAAAQEVSHD